MLKYFTEELVPWKHDICGLQHKKKISLDQLNQESESVTLLKTNVLVPKNFPMLYFERPNTLYFQHYNYVFAYHLNANKHRREFIACVHFYCLTYFPLLD